jgi:hypothetical protein
MGYTKRDIINQAFDEIGLAGYVFDLQPQQIESALRRLDAMMATWNGKGVRLGYPLPTSVGDSDVDQAINVPDVAIEAMTLNLAVRIAPSYGKTVSPDTRSIASTAYKGLLSKSVAPVEMQLDNMSIPAGQGNKTWQFRNDAFLRQPSDQLTAGPDGLLDLE